MENEISQAIHNIVDSLNFRLSDWKMCKGLEHSCGIRIKTRVVCEPGGQKEIVLCKLRDVIDNILGNYKHEIEINLNENEKKVLHEAFDTAMTKIFKKSVREEKKRNEENRKWLEEVTKKI